MPKQLSVEEEAKRRGVSAYIIELERRVNGAFNQPEFLNKVNQELKRQETKAARTRRPKSDQRPQ